MKKLRSNEAGFSVIELVLIIVIVVLIGISGWLVYKIHNKSKTAATNIKTTTTSIPKTISSTIVSTVDGKVSIKLPNDWEVSSQYLNNNAPIINLATSTNGCININDPNPCTYETGFLPKTIVDGIYGSITDPSSPVGNDSWTLEVEKTQWTMAEAINEVGGFSAADTIAENNIPINGYSAHYIEGYYGPPITKQSVFAFYVIEHDGYLAVFDEHIQPDGSQTNPITSDSIFNSEFTSIAQSIKFNF
jgi:hypothetical protein